jgi:hypothetical protein
MALSLICPTCRKTIQAPEKLAGQKGACPFCKTVIKIPHPNGEANVGAGARADTGEINTPALRPCSDCGKMVSRRAGQCPNCGCPVDAVNDKGTTTTNAEKQAKAVNRPTPLWEKVVQGVSAGIIAIMALLAVYFVFIQPSGGGASHAKHNAQTRVGDVIHPFGKTVWLRRALFDQYAELLRAGDKVAADAFKSRNVFGPQPFSGPPESLWTTPSEVRVLAIEPDALKVLIKDGYPNGATGWMTR